MIMYEVIIVNTTSVGEFTTEILVDNEPEALKILEHVITHYRHTTCTVNPIRVYSTCEDALQDMNL